MTTPTITWSEPKALNKSNLAYVPHSSGVYKLTYNANVIYVGESGNIRERLARHEAGSENPCVARYIARGVLFHVALVAGEAARKRIERQLIARHDPECNRT